MDWTLPELVLLLGFAHCLCDFPLQSDKIALGKCPGNQVEGIAWLQLHCRCTFWSPTV